MRNLLRLMLLHAARLLGLLMLCGAALQLSFLARVALMAHVDPSSTTFQRTQAVRILQL